MLPVGACIADFAFALETGIKDFCLVFAGDGLQGITGLMGCHPLQ